MKKMGLGRGLDALLPETNDLDNMVSMIAVTEIDRNPDQPRRDFDEAALQTLADSIRTAGVLQPLLVVEQNGRYRIVAGERRFRAARIAGLDKVPCIVRDLSAQEQMEAATEELNAKEYTASAGGGMVTVTISGELEIKKMEISPDVVDPEDIEMLQDLVTAAVNEAIRNANADKEETMNAISGGMNLGGMGGLF